MDVVEGLRNPIPQQRLGLEEVYSRKHLEEVERLAVRLSATTPGVYGMALAPAACW